MLASEGADNIINLWGVAQDMDVSTSPLVTFVGHIGPVNSVAFSPDGNMFASGGLDGVVYLWDLNAFVKPKE